MGRVRWDGGWGMGDDDEEDEDDKEDGDGAITTTTINFLRVSVLGKYRPMQ